MTSTLLNIEANRFLRREGKYLSFIEAYYWPATFMLTGMLLIFCSTLWTKESLALTFSLGIAGVVALGYGLLWLRPKQKVNESTVGTATQQQLELHYDDLALPLLRYIFDVENTEGNALHGINNSTDIMVRIHIFETGEHVSIQLFDTSGEYPIALSSKFDYFGAEARRILRLLE